MTTHTDLPLVEAELNYTAPTTEKLRNYTYEPPEGVARSNSAREAHRVPIHSVRPIASDVTLDREGFAVLHHASEVRDFYDEDELRRVYYGEAERLIAEATGASKVFVFDHTLRRRVLGWMIGPPARHASPRRACTSITPRIPARSACATFSAMKRSNCCVGECR